MSKMNYVQAVNDALKEEMRRDENVFMVGEDIAVHGNVFGFCKGMLEEFGDKRIKDTPISETGFVGLGVGAAITGLRPIVDLMYIDFALVCMDQIVNQAAQLRYMTGGMVKVPMVITTQQGYGIGEAAHHGKSLESWFAHIPGLKVVIPSDAYQAKGLLKTAVRDDNPVLFINHKLLFHHQVDVPQEEYTIPLGQADVKRRGEDITVVATGFMVQRALKVAESLRKEDISIEVIDPRTITPFDNETVAESVRKTGRLIVLQDATTRVSMGGEIVRVVVEDCFSSLKAPPRVLGAGFNPIPYAEVLENATVPQEKDVIEAVRSMVWAVAAK